MGSLFPAEVLGEIKHRIRLSDLIGRDVKLRPSGREFKGLSPFNEEKTPSFTVDDHKGVFYCFSSKKHGDAFQWLVFTKSVSFPEAVRILAEMTGVALPATPTSQRNDDRATLVRACTLAASYWRDQLQSTEDGRPAREYLSQRGVSVEVAETYKLGWAPRSTFGMISTLKRAGVSENTMRQAGLLASDSKAGFFRNRLMIPITNLQGRHIGFGGRDVLGENPSSPKYLNSRETAIFRKREAFYALDAALRPATRAGRLIVVEGYFDTIAMREFGFQEAIGAQGTAVDLGCLRHLVPNIVEHVFLLDGDRAGQGGHDRIIDAALCEAGPASVTKFARLQGGDDPDEFLRRQGRDTMETLLSQATSLEAALWSSVLARWQRDRGPEARSAVIGELIKRIQGIRHEETRQWFHTSLAIRIEQEFGIKRRLEDIL